MCRMLLAPRGIRGGSVIEPFLRMAQGRNAHHELSCEPGGFTHPDGWGAVIEADGRLVRVRSARACWDDPGIRALADRRVFLLHARRASMGGVRVENVHPFERELRGQPWFFCHNGTIRDPLPRPPEAQGETDSEVYFGILLHAAARPDPLESVARMVSSLEDYTSLNGYLLSEDGAFVVCAWRDLAVYYTLHRRETPEGPLFSSEPLAEFGLGWHALSCGEIDWVDSASGRVTEARVPLWQA